LLPRKPLRTTPETSKPLTSRPPGFDATIVAAAADAAKRAAL